MRALIVDGYNALHAWPMLRPMMHSDRLADARAQLIAMLGEYAASTGIDVTVVFDSHNYSGPEQVHQIDGITVRYGTTAASADHVIERLAYKATRHGLAHDIIVATTDRLQRELVIAMGVGVMTTLELCTEVERTTADTQSQVEARHNEARLSQRLEDQLDGDLRRRLEQMRRGETGIPEDDSDSE